MQTAIGNILTNFEILGKENTQAFVILHGWGRNILDWIPVAKVLSSRYRVILLDLPGFGGTILPSDTVMGTYDYAEFTKSFLEKIGVRKPILLGHSFGGRIGMVLGSEKGLISKLILVDSAGIEQKSLRVILIGFFYKIIKRFLPEHINKIIRARLGSEDYANAGLLRKILVKVVNEDLRNLLPKIKIPVLIIWGDKDINQYVKYAKIKRDEISGAKLRIVWGAGHNPHYEKPSEFIQILEEENI